ncbi:hypothetical protein V6N11_012492 [Hibiscus sabdariffa]|uniref:DUF4219 domain-containing protein n=1 Tax=Hibiscus sabdariffa TaxID=183260 RepID=A0ABR2QBA2_9ROSI
MSHSIDKPPFFNGEHYAYLNNRMMFFIKGKDFHLWDIVEDGPFMPTRRKSEWDANDRMKMKLNCKALHILFCALGPDEYVKVSSCESAKKKTVIIEAKNLKELKLDELIGSLLTHEMMSIPLKRENEKKIKEQGVDVNIIALKFSKCHLEDSK